MMRVFLISFFVFLTLFRIYFSGHFNLTPDEAYYWFWSEHLHLSYYDHPPMVAWLIKISTLVFGQKEWAIRLPAIVTGIGDTFLIFLLGKKVFKSSEAGILSAVLLNSIMIFSAGMVIMTPDTPQLFFWTLALYFSYVASIENRPDAWFLTGMATGLGLLSKYTMVLFLPSIFIFLLAIPSYRRHLYSWKPWCALFIAILIFSPVIIWNANHHWISFLFQLHHGTSSREAFGLRYLFEFLGGQAGVFSPLIFVGLLWSLMRAYKIGRKKNLHQFAFLFWMGFPLFVFFIYESLHTKIEANWPVFSQTGSIVLLGGFFHQKLRDRKDSRPIRYSIYFTVLLSFMVMMAAHMQALTKFVPLRVEMDRTNDLIGWERLREIDQRNPETKAWPILTTSHTLVGEASFYLERKKVYQWGSPFRVTDISQSPAGSIQRGESVLLISFDDDRFSQGAMSLFDKIIPLGDILVYIKRGGTLLPIRTYHYFKGENFLGTTLQN